MSGFESSNRDAAPAVDPLALTVYELAAPQAGAAEKQVRRGRIKLLLVLLVCASPVIASYFTYYVIRPQGRTNYGTLIEPTRALPALEVRTLAGASVPLASLRGQWLLLAVGASGCDQDCERRLYAQRQLREMLGRERDRVDKVWLVTDEGMPSAALQQALQAQPAVTVLRFPLAALQQWLAPAPGHALHEHLYLVDPRGQWMMRFPVAFEPAKVKRDIDRLLRASAAWDRPGR